MAVALQGGGECCSVIDLEGLVLPEFLKQANVGENGISGLGCLSSPERSEEFVQLGDFGGLIAFAFTLLCREVFDFR